jgi:hypothetical protein
MFRSRADFAPRIPIFLTAMAVALSIAGSADSKARSDRYLHPKFSEQAIGSIALLPVSMLNPEEGVPSLIRRHLEHALVPTGYRFVSESTLRSSARDAGVTSAVDELQGRWARSGVLDSTSLRALGGARAADAVLAARVTTWERQVIDYNMTGSSKTQIGLQLSLYSTRTGELLWQDRFLEKGEGPYNNPADGGANVMGVTRTGLRNEARTSTALDPPTYEEVATKLERKIQTAFPPPAKTAKPSGT